MITAQNIKEKTFEKAVFGGYDMSGVDDFLDAVATDYAALQKENSVLKAKMKVLVEKIEEYRSSGDAMQMALVAAQKTGTEIVEKAKAEAAAIIDEANRTKAAILTEAKETAARLVAEAQAKREEILSNLQQEVSVEEARLVEAKRSSAEFIENMRLVCNKQLNFFDGLAGVLPKAEEPEAVPAPAPAEEKDEDFDITIRSIESSVAAAAPAPEIELPVESPFVDENPTRPFVPGKDDDGLPKTQFNFENLRFGR